MTFVLNRRILNRCERYDTPSRIGEGRIVEMHGTLENGQAASLAGLAPFARQSGQWTGRTFIRGGRANVRQRLYMPALRFNPDLKAKYQQLKAAGKPSKVAITAIMRKLIILANALLRDRRNWDQSPA